MVVELGNSYPTSEDRVRNNSNPLHSRKPTGDPSIEKRFEAFNSHFSTKKKSLRSVKSLTNDEVEDNGERNRKSIEPDGKSNRLVPPPLKNNEKNEEKKTTKWTIIFDTTHGRNYYYDASTNYFTWDEPGDLWEIGG